jgi:hypothetical protein
LVIFITQKKPSKIPLNWYFKGSEFSGLYHLVSLTNPPSHKASDGQRKSPRKGMLNAG